jgi:hypothetical protein
MVEADVEEFYGSVIHSSSIDPSIHSTTTRCLLGDDHGDHSDIIDEND